MKNNPKIIKETDEDGLTALMISAKSGNIDIINKLFFMGVEINQTDVNNIHYFNIILRLILCIKYRIFYNYI